MNLKLVLRTYSALRQLTDDESALLNTLRAMNDTERELLVESLQPQKSAGKKAAKTERKVEHCAACDYTKRHAVHKDSARDDYHEFQSSTPKKSARASEIATQLNKNLSQQREVVLRDITDENANALCSKCDKVADSNAHHLKADPDYHEFVPPAQSAAAGSGD